MQSVAGGEGPLASQRAPARAQGPRAPAGICRTRAEQAALALAAAPPPGHQGRAYSETHSPARSQHSPNSQATTSRVGSTSNRRRWERCPGPGGGCSCPPRTPATYAPRGRDTLLWAGAVSGACQGLVSETRTDTCA